MYDILYVLQGRQYNLYLKILSVFQERIEVRMLIYIYFHLVPEILLANGPKSCFDEDVQEQRKISGEKYF